MGNELSISFGNFVVDVLIIEKKRPLCRGLVPVYRSVPPVSTTSTISSRTARISVPLLVVSRRNSAKFGDMIKIVSVYIMGLSPITLSGIEPLSYCLSSIFIMFPRITNDRHRSPTK